MFIYKNTSRHLLKINTRKGITWCTLLSACNCHPDGSKHQNCTQFGVCECLPGVSGIKCDQCPENKYNLSAGCIGKYLKKLFSDETSLFKCTYL